MAAFFSQQRGAVAMVGPGAGVAAAPFAVRMEGLAVIGPGSDAILTQVAVAEQGNYQFLHTLGDTIYVYVFGDRIGEIRLSGLCFANACRQGSGALPGASADGGINTILKTYRANKLATRSNPVQINIGPAAGDVYRGFLTGMTMEILDAEHQIGQWAFRFNTFPSS